MRKPFYLCSTRVRARIAGVSILVLMVSACGESPGVQPSAPSEARPQLDRLPTLEGIDANRDGVRDDIAWHIEKTYADPAQRRAAMQTARALQQTLLVDKKDAVALEVVSGLLMSSIACVRRDAFSAESATLQGSRLIGELEALTTNTKERLQAYLAYNKARSGSVSVRLSEGNYCE